MLIKQILSLSLSLSNTFTYVFHVLCVHIIIIIVTVVADDDSAVSPVHLSGQSVRDKTRRRPRHGRFPVSVDEIVVGGDGSDDAPCRRPCTVLVGRGVNATGPTRRRRRRQAAAVMSVVGWWRRWRCYTNAERDGGVGIRLSPVPSANRRRRPAGTAAG